MTSKPPRFEIIYDTYKDSEIIEILKDGKPFWEDLPDAKDHFRFGKNKAKMLLTCFDEIKQFQGADGYLPDESLNKPIQSNLYGKTCLIRLKYHKGAPYLEITDATQQIKTTKKSNKKKIGIGRMKSEAIIDLYNKISDFSLKPS